LLFGTDTGFLTDYDMTEEYRQLYLAGLSYRDVLAMLTTAPAQHFHVSDHEGLIALGMSGDLTILSSDPASSDPHRLHPCPLHHPQRPHPLQPALI
ncbi:MAG TPA: amidohydrolase family protein, partial [Edaphobacter sp.]